MSYVSQKNSKTVDKEVLFFQKVLLDVGVSLSLNVESHILTKEQSLVVRDLCKYFEENSQEAAENFIKGFQKLCKDEDWLQQSLQSTILKKPNQNDFIADSQESLFRLLLKVEYIQEAVLEVLIQEIISLMEDDKTEDTRLLRLLLSPLRFLPFIKNSFLLATKLLDILEIANFPSQLEILESIHNIIPDSEYYEVAKQLCKLLNHNDDLTGAIIDCLTFLNLEPDVKAEIQDKILAKMLAGSSLKVFPIFLQFLLSDFKSQTVVETLFKIRNSLDNIMGSTGINHENESHKIVIFNNLQNLTIPQKSLVEGWLNTISTIKVHSDHKPIDLIILFMLHHIIETKRRIIEVIIRKRVSLGLFRVNLLEKLFEKYLPQQLFKDYFNNILDIGSSLLQTSSQPLVVEFASTLFQLLFNHKHTEKLFRSELLRNLILLIGISNNKNTHNILKIMKRLLENTKLLREHTSLLMQLLERTDNLELRDIKEIFEILCTLTCSEGTDDSLLGLKNEIITLIRKQLSSADREIKYRGIVASVVMIKHIVTTSESQNESSLLEDSVSTEDLLTECAKEAAEILKLTNKCTDKCSELKGFFFDELSFVFRVSQHMDKYFITWLNDKITEDFLKKFLVQHVPDIFNDLEFSVQYMLNTCEEMDNPYWVNIGHLTATANNAIVLLAPHFCILRLLNHKNNAGDLTSIDALLGCGIIMPKFEDIHDLDTHQLKCVADSLFYCSNWFREIISGFVGQRSKHLNVKLVKRLQNLVEIEILLNNCLELIPDHHLPLSYFDSLSQFSKQSSPIKLEKKKNQKKKFKSAAIVDNANVTVASTISTSTQKSTKRTGPAKKILPREHKIYFRDLDTEILELFKYPLVLEDIDDEESCSQSIVLNIDQVKFLLKDFVTKLSVATQGTNIGLSHMNVVISAKLLITNCIQIIPNINQTFKLLVRKITQLLEKCDNRHDLPEMFTEEALNVQTCFGLVLEIFYYVFSWSGFQQSSNMDLLKNILKSMRPENSQTLNSANRLTIEFMFRLGSYTDQCLNLNHASNLIKTMIALKSISTPNTDTQKKIASVSGKLLSKRWYNTSGNIDHGKSCNLNIHILVESYLSSANIKTLCGLVGTLQDQAGSLTTKEDCLHMLCSIDKQNFHVFYSGLCKALLDRIKSEIQSLTNNEHLVLWQTTALTMQGLMSIAKAQQSKTVLSCFLKKCIGILKVFCSHGVPILEIMLKHKTDEVVKIFKTIQTTTRFLHQLCCTPSVNKDASLVAHVPQFRLTLESLVYRVKAALVANDCSAAFWMGILKNKDIHGEEILSQSTISDRDESEDLNDKLPSDDEEEQNEDNLNENSSDHSLADSEVFD